MRQFVETSDCVLLLGVLMTDLNMGIFTSQLERQRCIHALNDRVAIGYHIFENVQFSDLCMGRLRQI